MQQLSFFSAKRDISNAVANNLSQGASRPAVVPLQGRFTEKVIQRNPKEILDATKNTLGFGRGNVWTDIRHNEGESYKRTMGAMAVGSSRQYRGESRNLFNCIPPKLHARLKDVLPFMVMGAGNCMEHAVVAMFQTNHKYPGKYIWLMSWGGGDHQFLLVGDGNNIDASIVIDAWDTEQNGKPYNKSEWRHVGNRVESPTPLIADGQDYLGLAIGRLGDTSEMAGFGVAEGNKKSRGIDFSSYNAFKESSPEFKIYNF